MWKKLPVAKDAPPLMECCCGARGHIHMGNQIVVGFGDAGYSKDGHYLWTESEFDHDSNEPAPTVADVEKLAAADPDHDWRIYFFAPLSEAEYQRQGPNKWVLVRSGKGFA
jgi:hypothetical protein